MSGSLCRNMDGIEATVENAVNGMEVGVHEVKVADMDEVAEVEKKFYEVAFG